MKPEKQKKALSFEISSYRAEISLLRQRYPYFVRDIFLCSVFRK